MAFENQMIASMNNPNAAAAWREASRQHHWKMIHADHSAAREEAIDRLTEHLKHRQKIQEQVQKELLASREENRAVHIELGEMHEVQQSALTLASTYSEAYFEQQVRASRAEKIAFAAAMCAFTGLGLQAVGVWGFVLGRLV